MTNDKLMTHIAELRENIDDKKLSKSQVRSEITDFLGLEIFSKIRKV